MSPGILKVSKQIKQIKGYLTTSETLRVKTHLVVKAVIREGRGDTARDPLLLLLDAQPAELLEEAGGKGGEWDKT